MRFNIKLDNRYKSSGINTHLTWIYSQDGIIAGIDRNNDVYGDKYHCFEEYNIRAECETIWYPTLKSARKVVQQYLNGEIARIPTRIPTRNCR